MLKSLQSTYAPERHTKLSSMKIILAAGHKYREIGAQHFLTRAIAKRPKMFPPMTVGGRTGLTTTGLGSGCGCGWPLPQRSGTLPNSSGLWHGFVRGQVALIEVGQLLNIIGTHAHPLPRTIVPLLKQLFLDENRNT